MARKYDSTRRQEAAQKTKEAILDAAFKLHGAGIFDLDVLASEAKVSLATVRKYFPTRDELFVGCTTWGMRYAEFPEPEVIAAVEDREERVRVTVVQMHRLYDSLFGHLWGTYQNKEDSAVLDAVLEEMETAIVPVVQLMLAAWPEDVASNAEARGLVRGFVSYLTYFALIREGGLTADRATSRICEAILSSLRAMSSRGEKEVSAA